MKYGVMRAIIGVLLLVIGLALSSCVVYEEPGHWHGDHGWHDHWR